MLGLAARKRGTLIGEGEGEDERREETNEVKDWMLRGLLDLS